MGAVPPRLPGGKRQGGPGAGLPPFFKSLRQIFALAPFLLFAGEAAIILAIKNALAHSMQGREFLVCRNYRAMGPGGLLPRLRPIEGTVRIKNLKNEVRFYVSKSC